MVKMMVKEFCVDYTVHESEKYTKLENAENKLDDVGKSSCDWWGDCWTNSGY